MIVQRPPRSWERLSALWSRIYRAENRAESAATRTFSDSENRRHRIRAERLRSMRTRVECLRHGAPKSL